ncbi:hypothetical protein [Paucilactobacillus suebicus]|nr:hypothetical protein [Paucilactobacillus suebicus]
MHTLKITLTNKALNVRVSHVHLKANFITKFGETRMQNAGDFCTFN